jgi:hypothetical protein
MHVLPLPNRRVKCGSCLDVKPCVEQACRLYAARRSRSRRRARIGGSRVSFGHRRVAPSHKGGAFTSILDPYRLAHVVANRLPCGVRDPRNEHHMGLAPNHHLPLAAVHSHTIARHNPGSDPLLRCDLALAAYCQPKRRLRADALFRSIIAETTQPACSSDDNRRHTRPTYFSVGIRNAPVTSLAGFRGPSHQPGRSLGRGGLASLVFGSKGQQRERNTDESGVC